MLLQLSGTRLRYALEALLQRAWQRRGALAYTLLPLALLYRLAMALRRIGYARGWLRSHAVGVPVLVVGNLVAGGSGKTPLVLELLRHWRARGVAVGVVSRGHGRERARGLPDVCEVQDDSRAAQVGDEPLLLRCRTDAPVFVGRDRVAAARALLARHPRLDVLVCDDGLQHLALRRDAEICVLGAQGLGNGWLLPAGPLREPSRVVTWVLDAGQAVSAASVPSSRGRFACRRRLADHALRADGTRVALEALLGKPLWAVAGIAHPQRFFEMLRQRGLTLDSCEALPDHTNFSGWDGSGSIGKTLVCTEKDAVKLWLLRPDALAVPLVLDLDPAFFDSLDAWLASLSSAHGHPTS